MRLLHTTEFTFRESDHEEVEPYAILSHCWSKHFDDQEVTYQQVLALDIREESYGWRKVLQCCRIARARGFKWVWLDTCCIDKTNLVELSEAINSMYEWYRRSAECYVFMDDVSPSTDDRLTEQSKTFANSRWFRRGWTLQELLAPSELLFYDQDREYIGSKISLAGQISQATGIDEAYLTRERDIRNASIAQRMSWAASRDTTRLEDTAYCLLGLFDVNLPLIYGEGNKAFLRLQLAIIDQTNDDSILAWGLDRPSDPLGVLACSPRDFFGSQHVVSTISPWTSRPPFQNTNRGIQYYYLASLADIYPDSLKWKAGYSLGFALNGEPRSIRLACRVQEERNAIRLDISERGMDGICYRTNIRTDSQSDILEEIGKAFGLSRYLFLGPRPQLYPQTVHSDAEADTLLRSRHYIKLAVVFSYYASFVGSVLLWVHAVRGPTDPRVVLFPLMFNAIRNKGVLLYLTWWILLGTLASHSSHVDEETNVRRGTMKYYDVIAMLLLSLNTREVIRVAQLLDVGLRRRRYGTKFLPLERWQ